MPLPWKLIGGLALALAIAAGAWQVQDWRYGKQLAEQARLQGDTLNELTLAAAAATERAGQAPGA